MRHLVSLAALSLACAACDPPVPATDATAPPTSVASASPTAAPAPEGPRTPPSAGELDALARSTNAFACDLYARARAQSGNLALSPLSISTALTMTWAGARGDTAAQMARVLHLEGTVEHVLELSGKLLASYEDPAQKVTLRLANRLFGEKTYAFDRGYLDRTAAAFGAPLEPLDFRHATDESRKHINVWVAQATQDRIKDLIPPQGLDAETRLVLANAIYFLGDWQAPFKKEATSPAPFHTSRSDSKDVPTMHQTTQLRFAATDGVKLLELPYEGGQLAMTLVLPDAVDGLDAVEARLTAATLEAWTRALAPDQLVVALPSFEIDPAGSLPLGETLKALGMPLAFDPRAADLTGIANPANPADRLYVGQVFHKAFVKLDEKGTEAAAATAVVVARSHAVHQAPALEFRADHPFLFLLRDARSGMILFMGRVDDPTAK